MTSQCSTTLPSSTLNMSTICRPGVPWHHDGVDVQRHQVALGDHPLHFVAGGRIPVAAELDEAEKALGPVGDVGVVLDVGVAEVPFGLVDVLLVQSGFVERQDDLAGR